MLEAHTVTRGAEAERAASAAFVVKRVAKDPASAINLGGPITAALMANGERLRAAPPEILRADVLAAMLPA